METNKESKYFSKFYPWKMDIKEWWKMPRGLDAVIFIPLGVLLIGISYYYKFIDR